MDTNATGKLKVITENKDLRLHLDGYSNYYTSVSYQSLFKMTYNPESDNTEFFLAALGHIWMALRSVWPNAPKMVLRWDGETERGWDP